MGWRLTFLGSAALGGTGTLAVALLARFPISQLVSLDGVPIHLNKTTNALIYPTTSVFKCIGDGDDALKLLLTTLRLVLSVRTTSLVFSQVRGECGNGRCILVELRVKTTAHIIFLILLPQALFGTIPWAVLSVFLSDFLIQDQV